MLEREYIHMDIDLSFYLMITLLASNMNGRKDLMGQAKYLMVVIQMHPGSAKV